MAEKTISVQVLGLRELGEAMRKLGEDISVKIARRAVNAGAQVIKPIAVANALAINRGEPDTDGEYIAPNIIVRRQRGPKKGQGLTAQYAVTVRHKGKIENPKKAGAANPYGVGILNEFGTVKMSAFPFMRPAFDSGKQQALDAIVATLKERIDQANKVKR